MKNNVIYCDHCGIALDTMVDFDDTTVEMAHKYLVTDLCANCLNELYEIVSNFCTEKEQQQ